MGINKHLTIMMRFLSIDTLIQNPVAVSLIALRLTQTTKIDAKYYSGEDVCLLYKAIFMSLLTK